MILDNNPLTGLLKPPVESDSWLWATVTSINPLLVRLDGETYPLAASPDTLTSVEVNDRVRVHLYQRRAVIIGKKSPPVAPPPPPPAPVQPEANFIWIDGKKWQQTGRAYISNHTLTAWNGWFISPAEVTVPISIPPKYGLIVAPSAVSGYKAISMVGNKTFRYLSTNNAPITYVNWTLVYTNV